MVVVAEVISQTHGLDARNVLSKMCELREFKIEMMPSLYEAATTANVSIPYFIRDYSKIQYLYERNPAMEQLPQLLMQI